MQTDPSLAQLFDVALHDAEGKAVRLADLPGRYVLLVLLRHLG